MKSIKHKINQTIEIKRSVFHTYLIPVKSLDEVTLELKNLRLLYPDATHHCTAYILGDHQETQKYDDDGEPSGTAGLPILEVLKKHDVTNILCVVVRYYGGVKLGGGGLVRAYTKGASDALKEAIFTFKENVILFEIHASFDLGGKIESFVREETEFIETIYSDHITFIAQLKESEFEQFNHKLSDQSSGKLTTTIVKTLSRYI